MNNDIELAVDKYAVEFGIEAAAGKAFIEVESGGKGFDTTTGKILIQFEPSWFKKKAPQIKMSVWSANKVDIQPKEWEAFNDASRQDPIAAMESTSIGLGQVMGFHWKRLEYRSVCEMWNDAKKGIDRQVWQMFKFIDTDPRLKNALVNKNWQLVATYYNGTGYMDIAKKYGREPYNISMEKAYKKYSIKSQ